MLRDPGARHRDPSHSQASRGSLEEEAVQVPLVWFALAGRMRKMGWAAGRHT